ncbi:MAG: site-specific integrase [Candidatus Tokpelaia sp.]|nr:MAG: site-specific integrase [Candidatus Tokpelaia sp.]KAA6205634.1 MAG: site-specific integrase [Candidatus Tokpelaia sp.]
MPKSAHNIRKIAAVRSANAGATEKQLTAFFGWTSDAMPSLYTRSADRKKMAVEAIEMLVRTNGK